MLLQFFRYPELGAAGPGVLLQLCRAGDNGLFVDQLPLVLILVGIIYIQETLSDILQVGYFKLTHGKRIFRMAPLHHHLELGGWSEVKLFCVFSGVTLLACVLAFLGVMGR